MPYMPNLTWVYYKLSMFDILMMIIYVWVVYCLAETEIAIATVTAQKNVDPFRGVSITNDRILYVSFYQDYIL